MDGTFNAPETHPGLGRLMKAFRLVTEARPSEERIVLAQRRGRFKRQLPPEEVQDAALKAGIIDAQEVRTLKQALAARLEAIEVDVFTPDQFYVEPARTGRFTPREAPGKVAAHA